MSEMDHIKTMAEALLASKIGDEVISSHDYLSLCISFEGLIIALQDTDCNPRTILALRDAIFRQYMAKGNSVISVDLWEHICGEFNPDPD